MFDRSLLNSKAVSQQSVPCVQVRRGYTKPTSWRNTLSTCKHEQFQEGGLCIPASCFSETKTRSTDSQTKVKSASTPAFTKFTDTPEKQRVAWMKPKNLLATPTQNECVRNRIHLRNAPGIQQYYTLQGKVCLGVSVGSETWGFFSFCHHHPRWCNSRHQSAPRYNHVRSSELTEPFASTLASGRLVTLPTDLSSAHCTMPSLHNSVMLTLPRTR